MLVLGYRPHRAAEPGTYSASSGCESTQVAPLVACGFVVRVKHSAMPSVGYALSAPDSCRLSRRLRRRAWRRLYVKANCVDVH